MMAADGVPAAWLWHVAALMNQSPSLLARAEAPHVIQGLVVRCETAKHVYVPSLGHEGHACTSSLRGQVSSVRMVRWGVGRQDRGELPIDLDLDHHI